VDLGSPQVFHFKTVLFILYNNKKYRVSEKFSGRGAKAKTKYSVGIVEVESNKIIYS
jgi:hypothetical protein